MENNQESQSQVQEASQSAAPSNVSFPSVNSPKKSSGAKTLLILGALILVAILGFAIFKSATKKSGTSSEATPIEGLSGDQGVAVASSTPASTPTDSDRRGVSIEVQNGTGISGEAAYLQTQLDNLGYTNVKVGNASDQNSTSTQVTFSNSVSQAIVNEITQKLNSIYQTVNTTTTNSSSTDVVIITGLRKGATPLPSPAETPTESPTPTSQ